MNTTVNVPFLDLISPHRELESELTSIFVAALGSAAFIGGPMVEDFEKSFAAFCDAQYCVGVSSGTDALRFALMAAGVGDGDIVVTVPNTFIATTEAITQVGARPKFVDIDEQTYNMDPVRLRRYLDEECDVDGKTGFLRDRESGMRVAAIVPVHLYGQMADMDPILEDARRHHLLVIEDACQAHGASYFSMSDGRWHKAGSMGHAAAFSFYPGKNLGACGEAGAVTTSDPDMVSRIRMIRDHGQWKKYHHRIEGYNGRLDAIQAGILTVKLNRLPHWNDLRIAHAGRYRELFASLAVDITLPFEPTWSRGVYHVYVIRVAQRDRLRQELESAGIGTAIHYPIPLHLQEAYVRLGYRVGDFPISERVAQEILSLPMYPQLTIEQQKVVAATLAAVSSVAVAAVS